MSDLLTRAELIKLSRTLGTDEARVAFLARYDHLDLRLLGERLTNALFSEYRVAFQRLADASRLLPASLVAKMSEMVFGPMLSARVAGSMPPDRAVEVAAKLKTKFMADVTMQLDPKSASEVLAAMPVKIIVEVAQALLERREYVTMGRFVDDLTDAAIRAVAAKIGDDEALLRIAFFVERRERLIELVELLPPERLRAIVSAVVGGPADLQQAGLAVMSQVSARQQGRIGEIAIGLGAEVLTTLIETAQRHEAGAVVGAVMEHVGAEGRRQFVMMLANVGDKTLAAWSRATTASGLWPVALRILAAADSRTQAQAATALQRLPRADRAAIEGAARAAKAWPLPGPLASALS